MGCQGKKVCLFSCFMKRNQNVYRLHSHPIVEGWGDNATSRAKNELGC